MVNGVRADHPIDIVYDNICIESFDLSTNNFANDDRIRARLSCHCTPPPKSDYMMDKPKAAFAAHRN